MSNFVPLPLNSLHFEPWSCSKKLKIYMFLFCRNNKEIDFYDINNLNEVLVTFPVAPHLPGRLCSTSGSTSGSKLLYEDESKHPHVIRWLDCSTSPPTPATGTSVTHIKIQSGIHDMCCAELKGKQFLITAPRT